MGQGTYQRTSEHRLKMSNSLKNSSAFQNAVHSEEYRLKQRKKSLARKACPPLLKGSKHPNFWKTGELSCHFKGYKYCIDCKKILSRRGKQYGRPDSLRCLRCAKKGKNTLLYRQLRNVIEYRQWRSDVFFRDNFTCQSCGIKGGILQAHHIKPFRIILEEYKILTLKNGMNCQELWNINNGTTLCNDCHSKTDSYFNRFSKKETKNVSP